MSRLSWCRHVQDLAGSDESHLNLAMTERLCLVAQGNASCTTLSTRFQVLRGFNKDAQDVQDRGECGWTGVVKQHASYASVAYVLFHPTDPRFSRTYQRTRRDENGVVAHWD